MSLPDFTPAERIASSGADEAIARIARGSNYLTSVVRKRIAHTLDFLDDGDFPAASEALREAQSTMMHLAAASAHLGIAGDAILVCAPELEVGMEIVDVGEITQIERADCEEFNCPGHFALKIDGERVLQMRGNQEIFIKVDS